VDQIETQSRRATLVDVAHRAKVSTSAVSRTFTTGGSVSKKTRDRVLKAAEELGFRPNILARSLMTGRSALIGLVSDAFGNPYVMNILDVFTSELQKKNLRPLVFNLTGKHDWNETVALMSQYQIDGLVIASSTLDSAFLETVWRSRIPTVITFGRSTDEQQIDAVFADNVEGGRIAARAFLRRGYKKLGFVGAPEHVTTSHDRLMGFREFLAHEGADAPTVIHAKDYSHASGLKATAELLRVHPELDGLFCADDLLGIGAVDALQTEFGRGVPDTGVIGFNDIQMASWPSHRLSSVRTHTDEIVISAIDMLEARIRKTSKPKEKRIISCELVVRQSLRPLM
jgi:DNA-binding LacI/PurR family transcriptional regulator